MPRLDAPGTLHHLTIRAIEKRNFVDDRKDREASVSRMGYVATATPTVIYAWPVMTNHGYILLRSEHEGPQSRGGGLQGQPNRC